MSKPFIKNEDWDRFFRFRQRVFDKIKEVDEGYHKSYEGAVEVRFYFENIYQANDVRDATVEIELHCYLLINGRHITWVANTFEEALTKAEKGFEELIRGEE